MTDRELLELAAKAMGYTTRHKWNAERLLLTPPVPALVVHKDGELVSTGWNPLDDDGHAMRLATELTMEIRHNANADETVWVMAYHAEGRASAIEGCSGPGYRLMATRRAIVRAAAEIGRDMP